MNYYKIVISRSGFIKKNRETAVLSLTLHKHSFGELVMVRYYLDEEETEIDTVVAIGIKDGIGLDCYRIITLGGGNIITKVVKELPDISKLVHGEIYIYIDNDNIPFYVYEVNGERQIEKITGGPYRYEVVEDGYRWYFLDGVVKREDDFYTRGEVDDIIEDAVSSILDEIKKIKEELKEHNDWLMELDKEVFPLTLSVNNTSGSLFLTGTTQDIRLVIRSERKKKDITKECTYKLNNSPIMLEEDNSYTKTGISSNTSLQIQSTYPELDMTVTSSPININFGYNYYYGIIPKDGWEVSESNIKNLENTKLSLKSSITYVTNLNLDHRIAFCCPKVYGKITSIKDQSNLEYITDYDEFECTVDGFEYYVYIKSTLVIYSGIKQIFNY